MNILCDIDGVIANTSGAVLKLYNKDYYDNVTNNDILEWNTHKFVKPECGEKVYDYYTRDDIYSYVEPIEGALFAVQYLRVKGHRVIFVTSGLTAAKVLWMMKYGLVLDRYYDPDLVFAHDKTLIAGDVLIDDKIENCRGRTSILFDQPWNRTENHVRRARDWTDVLDILEGRNA